MPDRRKAGIGGIAFKRTLAQAGRDLPAMFITALEPREVSEPLASLAPVAVLYKPFNKKDLLEAIRKARRRSKIRRVPRTAGLICHQIASSPSSTDEHGRRKQSVAGEHNEID
jgi:FixJ family two-component response regulator